LRRVIRRRSHTGAAVALSNIIRRGYVDALLAGNALAVHDIERDLYGTSLGLDIKTAELVSEGHKHHLYAISEVIRSGSIAAAVRQGSSKVASCTMRGQ